MNLRTPIGGLWVFVSSLCVSCASDFTPYNEVEGFRLLAIAADPPDLVPGSHATLSALVVDAPTPSYRWRWCPVTLGPAAEHECAFSDDELATPALGSTATVTLRLPEQRDLDTLCAAAATRPAPRGGLRLDCASDRPEVFVRLEVMNGDERIVAIHPVPIALRSQRNTNPTITDVRATLAGEPIDLGRTKIPVGSIDLELVVPAESAERYERADGAAKEILRATWFVDSGETETVRTAFIPDDAVATFDSLLRNTWRLDAPAPNAALYLVLRDDRGGVRWLRRGHGGGER